MAEGVLSVTVVSPEHVVFKDDVVGLVAPAWDGMVGVLPKHAPMLALLGVGVLALDLPGGGSRSFRVSGGVLKVERDQVIVLTEQAESAEPVAS